MKMKVVLRKNNCLAAIGEKPMEITDDKWNEVDGNAISDLHLALTDRVLSNVAEKNTAKEIWNTLTKLYEAKSLHNKIFLKRKLYTLRMAESTMVTDHINTLKTLFSQLTTLGHNIEENEPSVLNEESKRKNKKNRQASSQQAKALLVTRGRSTERSPSRSQNHGRSKSRSKKNVKCYNCGVTWHMTSRREWFHTYEHISRGSVYMGNDHALEIASIGTIKIKMFDGTIRTIGEVRHVKGLKKNLLSLGQMDSHGYKTHVENGIMKIVKGALVLMKAEKIDTNLFMLKGETLQEADACVASKGEESMMMRHLKLGHMSEQGLKILSEPKLLPGLKSAEAAKTACYIVNRSPSTVIGLKTTMEMWTGKPADYSYLHAFGCPVYVMYNAQERTKLDPKSRRCIFLGYADGVKGYRLWDPTANKIVISRDVIFIEDQLQRRDDDDNRVKEKSKTIPVYVENNPEDSDSSEAAPEYEEQEPVEFEAPEVRRSARERRPPTWHSEYVTEINVAYCLLTEDREPSTFHEALESSNVALWITAMQEEIEALHKNKTWELVPLPCGRKTIRNKWVYKIKLDVNDQVERYHARLVVKGYAQKEGIDFNEICSPVVRLTTVRVVLAILSSNHCAYYKRFEDNDFIILLLYVDDMLVAGLNKDRIQELKAQLAREFEMKDLGPANKILGMQIHRDRNNKKILPSQKNYLKKILRRFNMQDYKSIFTSLPVNFKLSSSMCPSNEAERKEMSRVPYASAVGSLMFAMICIRPDIAQAVGAFTVRGYVDSDFAGDLDKRKSITGYVFVLSRTVVSWVSKLQTVVALSTTKAEYMAATQACKEAIWIQRLLEEFGHKQQKISVFCDSQSALHIARNPAFHSRTKHIGVQYHFVREVVEDGSVDLQKIHTKENLADVLTKPIKADKFI
ncbi:hypothetical protein KPL70_025262 [Citrus sinensis]|nr:hypothetical protein KPL70_025262 [Citrus sinensis]